jgi:hypothetical protein
VHRDRGRVGIGGAALGAGIAAGLLGHVIAGQRADDDDPCPPPIFEPANRPKLVECNMAGPGADSCSQTGRRCWPMLGGRPMGFNPASFRDRSKRDDYACRCIK